MCYEWAIELVLKYYHIERGLRNRVFRQNESTHSFFLGIHHHFLISMFGKGKIALWRNARLTDVPLCHDTTDSGRKRGRGNPTDRMPKMHFSFELLIEWNLAPETFLGEVRIRSLLIDQLTEEPHLILTAPKWMVYSLQIRKNSRTSFLMQLNI